MSTDPFVFIFFSVVSCSCIVCNSIPFTHDNNPFAMNPFDSRGAKGSAYLRTDSNCFGLAGFSCLLFKYCPT